MTTRTGYAELRPGVDRVTIAHGLPRVPNASDVRVTVMPWPTSGTVWIEVGIEELGARTFDICVSPAEPNDRDVYWTATCEDAEVFAP